MIALSPSGIVNPAIVAADLRTLFGVPNYTTFHDAIAYGLLYGVEQKTLDRAKAADESGAREFSWRRYGTTKWAHKDADGRVQMGRTP